MRPARSGNAWRITLGGGCGTAGEPFAERAQEQPRTIYVYVCVYETRLALCHVNVFSFTSYVFPPLVFIGCSIQCRR